MRFTIHLNSEGWGNRTGMWDEVSGGTQIQSITLQQSGGAPTNQIQSVTSGSTVTYTYDSAGNVTNDGAHGFTYDGENRIVSVDGGSTATYAYDQSNQRYKKTVGSTITHYIWQGSQVIAEHNGSTGASTADYVYSGSRMIAKAAGLTNQYFLSDRLSERLMLNASGSVIGRQGHLPFGEDFCESGTQEKHHFTSYERDSESGSDYAVNRQYSNSIATFNRPDPKSKSCDYANPQSLSRYAYVKSDPINRVDPLGLDDSLGESGGLQICDIEDGRVIPGSCEFVLVPISENEPKYNTPFKHQPRVDFKVLSKCVKDLFGVDLLNFTPSGPGTSGSTTVYGPERGNGGNNNTYTIINDIIDKSSSDLLAMVNQNRAARGKPPLPPGYSVVGLTLSSQPYANYTANDLTNPWTILRTQVHELGNSLQMITGTSNNDKRKVRDPDAGQLLENCVSNNHGFK